MAGGIGGKGALERGAETGITGRHARHRTREPERIPLMRMPFGKLMELVAELGRDDEVTLGELSRRWGEPAQRVGDAIDAVKVLRGEPSYIEVRG
jgi:hypothetical protein